MSKLVVGIVVIAVIVGIFMFFSRDTPNLAPPESVVKASPKAVQLAPRNVPTDFTGATSSYVDAQTFALTVAVSGSNGVANPTLSRSLLPKNSKS